MKTIAFTTTIPQEYIWASGNIPLDLNNYFITKTPHDFIKNGEKMGMPRNTCSWIKGLLGAMEEIKDTVSAIIAVTEGDCSNNHSLINLYQYYYPKIDIISFSYPTDKNPEKLQIELDKLGRYFGINHTEVNHTKASLDAIRLKIKQFDTLQSNNHVLPATLIQQKLVASSDFNGNYKQYELEIDAHIKELSGLNNRDQHRLKIGCMGVPTIITDLFDYLEGSFPIDITFFEVEQDFCMYDTNKSILEQYLHFKYPYDIFTRINHIKKEIKSRGLKAIIHYTQSFCHRQIDDILIHKLLGVPVLTIEGEAPDPLDMRTKNRIECFMENIIDITGG
ncbi:MAG: hypothetical protein A2Y40_01445 [Candidatus Margulisbacteria bacterium GWF2_35_9]|nr:MAG: hypothetical protein A2Y40_01445 [Candidatus Margulisbacteria bacterium GWF2_35_9]